MSQDKGIGEKIQDCVEDKGFCDYIKAVSGCKIGDHDGEISNSYELVLSDERYILVLGKPITGEDGNCLGTVVNLSDIQLPYKCQ